MQGPGEKRRGSQRRKQSCKCRAWLSPLGQVELSIGLTCVGSWQPVPPSYSNGT